MYLFLPYTSTTKFLKHKFKGLNSKLYYTNMTERVHIYLLRVVLDILHSYSVQSNIENVEYFTIECWFFILLQDDELSLAVRLGIYKMLYINTSKGLFTKIRGRFLIGFLNDSVLLFHFSVSAWPFNIFRFKVKLFMYEQIK